jgi:hypothetical protein
MTFSVCFEHDAGTVWIERVQWRRYPAEAMAAAAAVWGRGATNDASLQAQWSTLYPLGRDSYLSTVGRNRTHRGEAAGH